MNDKSNKKLRNLARITLVLTMVYFSSCDRSRVDKGYEYFPDMAHGHDYKTYSENPAMEDGRTMREPVEGTIPRHTQPYTYAADFDGRELAGQEVENPLTITPSVIAEGKHYYGIFCLQCHGENGDGQGILYTSGRYAIPPTSLLEERIVNQPAGESYHVISAGWGVMGAHASLITPERRWQIISFIENSIQNKK
jgi:mono/diheme cytochrome c family protein